MQPYAVMLLTIAACHGPDPAPSNPPVPKPAPAPAPADAATHAQIVPANCADAVHVWTTLPDGALDAATMARALGAASYLATAQVFDRCDDALLASLLEPAIARIDDQRPIFEAPRASGRVLVRDAALEILDTVTGQMLGTFPTDVPGADATIAAWRAWWTTASASPVDAIARGRELAHEAATATPAAQRARVRKARLHAQHVWTMHPLKQPITLAQIADPDWGAYAIRDGQLVRLTLEHHGELAVEVRVIAETVVNRFGATIGPNVVLRWPYHAALPLTQLARGDVQIPAAIIDDLEHHDSDTYSELLVETHRELTVVDGDVVVRLELLDGR